MVYLLSLLMKKHHKVVSRLTIMKESNRPFTDNRTDEEKERHQFDCDRTIYEKILERDRQFYNKMIIAIPNFPFKSFRSYRLSSRKNHRVSKIAKEYGLTFCQQMKNRSNKPLS